MKLVIFTTKDFRHLSLMRGFEQTFGCFLVHTHQTLVYLPSLSLHENMTNLANCLKIQEESMSLWEQVHGPPTTVFSQGWAINFIDTRISQPGSPGASFNIGNGRLDGGITQRDPSI